VVAHSWPSPSSPGGQVPVPRQVEHGPSCPAGTNRTTQPLPRQPGHSPAPMASLGVRGSGLGALTGTADDDACGPAARTR
jgi:hypothetical protein